MNLEKIFRYDDASKDTLIVAKSFLAAMSQNSTINWNLGADHLQGHVSSTCYADPERQPSSFEAKVWLLVSF